MSRINLIDQPEIFGKMQLSGALNNNSFIFIESKNISEKLLPNMTWCIKKGKLQISVKDGRIYMTGNWEGANAACAPGSISVSKPYKSLQNSKRFIISGKVANKKSQDPISAVISLQNGNKLISESKNNSVSGTYEIVFSPNSKKYLIQVTSKGYFPVQEIIALPEGKVNLIKNFYLSPLETGAQIRLNNVLFVQGEDEMLPESYPELNNLVKVMNDNRSIRIRLEGHTDLIGNADDNMNLSQKRVKIVKDYLINKSISKGRIETKAFGGTKPIKIDGTDKERKINRRVEFVILEK